jgi:hypothetical protein
MLPGAERTLQWSAGSTVGPVDLEVSRDSGTHWEPIATRVQETSYTWTVTPPFSFHARLRVSKTGASSIADASNADFVIGETTDVPPVGPATVSLSLPHPNPFAGTVSMSLQLAERTHASAAVYDPRGRRVRELVATELEAGSHPLAWDGRDETGARQSPGIYFVRVQAGSFQVIRRVALIH